MFLYRGALTENFPKLPRERESPINANEVTGRSKSSTKNKRNYTCSPHSYKDTIDKKKGTCQLDDNESTPL